MKVVKISLHGEEESFVVREVPDMLFEYLSEIALELNGSDQPDNSPSMLVEAVEYYKINKQ